MRKFWESIYYPNYITGYNPFLLRHMNKAIEKLSYAINNRKKIVVYGTSSVDGICSIASLILILRYLNADVEYVIHDGDKNAVSSYNIKNDIVKIQIVINKTIMVFLVCFKSFIFIHLHYI